MAGFDFNALFENPTFMMGASLLGNNSPDAMTQAIAAGQAMQRTKLAKQDKESEREMEKARTEVYRQQTETAKRRLDRDLASDENWYGKTVPSLMAGVPGLSPPQQGPQLAAQPAQGAPNAPQQPFTTQSGSALVPGSLGAGEVEPNVTQRAIERLQGDLKSIDSELARPTSSDQRMILTQEREKTNQKLTMLGAVGQKIEQQQLQAQAQVNPIANPAIAARNAKLMGALEMGRDPAKRGEAVIKFGEALEPKYGKPGDVNLNDGTTLPDEALRYRKEHDASEAARLNSQFQQSESRLSGQAASEDAGRKSLAEERTNLRTEKEGKYYTAHQSLNLSLDQMYDSVKRLKEHKGLDAVTGYRSMVPAALQGQEALNAKGEQEHLEAQVFTNASQAFRRANETGGSVGQQSDWEGKQFVDSWGRLKQAQGTPEYKDALDKLMVNVRAQQLRMKAAYDYYHGKQKGNTAPEQFKRIVATGTKDGKRMVKFEDGSVDSID